jgi:peptidoglycan/LPS O-acetylase OafA/YrhL
VKNRRTAVTLSLAIIMGALCLILQVKDGGNIDFYWKPSIIVWLAITLFACVRLRKNQALVWIRERWWLQIVVPIVLFGVALILVQLYEPHPMRHFFQGRSRRPENNARDVT